MWRRDPYILQLATKLDFNVLLETRMQLRLAFIVIAQNVPDFRFPLFYHCAVANFFTSCETFVPIKNTYKGRQECKQIGNH